MDIAEPCWYLANQPTGLVTVGLKYSFTLTILSDIDISPVDDSFVLK